MKKLTWLLVLSLIASGQVFAEQTDPYFKIKSITIHEHASPARPILIDPEVEDEGITIEAIITLGKQVYDIVKKGRPVVTTNYEPLSLLPKVEGVVVTPFGLENWQDPTAKKYTITFKNGFGMKVVDFDFTVHYVYGGQFKGYGRYLTGVQIVPESLDVSWGYTFNAQSKLVTTANHATSEDPLAGMVLMLSYQVDTLVKHHQRNLSFAIKGNGSFNAL